MHHWRLNFFILLTLSPLTIFAQNNQIHRASIEVMLQSLENMQPVLIDLKPIQENHVSAEPLPAVVHRLLSEINSALPGMPQFTARACKYCRATANLGTFEIYIEPAFVNDLRKHSSNPEEFEMTLRFVMAHEFSHYLYEVGMMATGLSVNGNKPYGQLRDQWQECNLERQWAHAEVDVIAVILMEKMGFAGASDVAIKLLEQKNYRCDGLARLTALRALSPKIALH